MSANLGATMQERGGSTLSSEGRGVPATGALEPPKYGKRQAVVPSTNKTEEIVKEACASQPNNHFTEEQHRAITSRHLAYLLVSILAGTVLMHYITVLMLILKGEPGAIQSLAQVFNVSLPVIASLASAAVTYYFTRKR
jgi:hypothetical protein